MIIFYLLFKIKMQKPFRLPNNLSSTPTPFRLPLQWAAKTMSRARNEKLAIFSPDTFDDWLDVG